MCNYKGHYPLFPYFISDWFHFGLTEDLFDLWNVKLATENDANFYLDSLGYSFLKVPFSFTNENVGLLVASVTPNSFAKALINVVLPTPILP